MNDPIRPFNLAIPDAELDMLRDRLRMTRWPPPETAPGWIQGVPLAQMKSVCHYWATAYDWRRCEWRLNETGQFVTRLMGLDIHFLHVRSPKRSALPLLLTHGWPGSVIEYLDVIGPLTNPLSHHGQALDAFDLIIPSLPGFGFSQAPTTCGWGSRQIAGAWIELMRRLGYEHFVAHGSDWGAVVTTTIARHAPSECIAIHLSTPLVPPEPDDATAVDEEGMRARQRVRAHQAEGLGYLVQQRTRPQTLGYGLSDSPIGQAAWILEKFHMWSDHASELDAAIRLDALLDNIMLYWLTNAATSSARIYWEDRDVTLKEPIETPTGISIFPSDLVSTSRGWVQRYYPNLIHWNRPVRGGHFPALEQPGLFVDEVRACFRQFQADGERED